MPRLSAFERQLRAAFGRTTEPGAVARALELIHAEECHDLSTARRLALQSERAQQRDRQSYNPHRTHTLVLEALNEWLGTCGDEYLGEVEMRDGPPVEYLNVGDPYVDTVVWFRDGYRGRHYHVMGWGDALEIAERRGWIRRDAAE